MGIIYNSSVKETEIYSAYGLIVYGKINRYVWTIRNGEEENALITFRIVDTDGNNIFSMNMGNNCIFQSQIDDTLDNFLWWIVEERPDEFTIEKQVFKSLCASNSIFNNSIRQRKEKQRRKIEEEKRIAKREEKRCIALNGIKEYCINKGLFYYIGYDEVVLIKANTNRDRKMIAEVQNKNDMKKMKQFVDYIRKYPENKSVSIVVSGSIGKVLDYIK